MARQIYPWVDVKARHPGTIAPSATSTSWTALTYSNDWADTGGAFGPGRYRLSETGLVELQGVIEDDSGTVGSGQTIIAVLPAGFRPGEELRWLVHAKVGGFELGADLVIQTGGALLWGGATGSTVTAIGLTFSYLAEA